MCDSCHGLTQQPATRTSRKQDTAERMKK